MRSILILGAAPLPAGGGDESGPAVAFVAREEGNLRPTAATADAIDKAVALPGVTTDINRKPRAAAPDLGAREFPGP
jgi:hypothetical protein